MPRPQRLPDCLLKGASVLSTLVILGCYDLNLFGPDTETGRALRSGTVTSAVDGSPIEGARIWWAYLGWVVGEGAVLQPDTAVTDSGGQYRLETEYYCDSQLWAEADGYARVTANLSYLACPDTQPSDVDIVLEPS